MTDVLLVDDHMAFTECLTAVLDNEPDIRCVDTATSAEEAMRSLARAQPDVVLLDIDLPDRDGLELARRIRRAHPGTQVLVLTAHTDPGVVRRSIASDVVGVLSKTSPIRTVLDAIRSVGSASNRADGDTERATVLDRHTLQRLVDDPKWGAGSGGPPDGGTSAPAVPGVPPMPLDDAGLTGRELEVLGLLANGLDPAAIAEALFISTHTARGHIKNILMKLGVHSQLEAVIAGARRGLVQIPTPATAQPEMRTAAS